MENEEFVKNSSNKRNLIIILIISIIVISLIGTYAWFIWTSKESTELTLTIGELADVSFSTGNDINVNNIGPVLDYTKDGEITTFVLRNKSELELLTNINLNISNLPEELKEESFKYILLSSNDNNIFTEIVSGNFKDKSNGVLSLVKEEPTKVGTTYYKFIIYIDGNMENPIDMMGKNFNAKIEVEVAEDLTGAEYIESLLPENPTTMNNDDPDGNVRYMGKDPNNYVSFNNELWRIIGVFDVASTNGGQPEKRLKIIRDQPIGNYSWDNKPSGTGSSTSEYGSNDWTDSASMQLLNNGPYWNRTNGTCPYGSNGAMTSCDFTLTGLTEETKTLIDNAVWNLGGASSYTSASNGLASHFYQYERGTNVYEGRSFYWIGKIGLMYLSDYGYATSGGTTTNRESCLAYQLIGWSNENYSDCKNNDYLYNDSLTQWTITPVDTVSHAVFYLQSYGYVSDYNNLVVPLALHPVLYLKSDVTITGGDGTSGNPYTLDI